MVIIISFMVFGLLFILLSRVIDSIYTLLLTALVGQGIVLLLLGGLNAKLLVNPQIKYIITGMVIVFTIAFLKMTLLQPLPGPIMAKEPSADMQVMTLETGSKIAYWHYPGQGKGTILFVHGGPGAHTRVMDRAYYKGFAKEGFDVYLYDQAGGGFSSPIPLQEVTMDRVIKDFDAFRRFIDTDQLILVGQSFGGNISATYASRYPDHVQAIIFTAPGDLRPKSLLSLAKEKKTLEGLDITFATESIEDFVPNFKEGVRFVAGILMAKYGGKKAAENLISQEEMMDYATRMIPEAIHMAYHNKYADRVPDIKSGGINILVNAVLNADYKKIGARVIEDIKELDIPVLILRTAYDYVPWEATKYYDEAFKNSHLVYITESGHIPWSVNVADTYEAMVYFLQGQYDQLKVYKGTDNPRLGR